MSMWMVFTGLCAVTKQLNLVHLSNIGVSKSHVHIENPVVKRWRFGTHTTLMSVLTSKFIPSNRSGCIVKEKVRFIWHRTINYPPSYKHHVGRGTLLHTGWVKRMRTPTSMKMKSFKCSITLFRGPVKTPWPPEVSKGIVPTSIQNRGQSLGQIYQFFRFCWIHLIMGNCTLPKPTIRGGHGKVWDRLLFFPLKYRVVVTSFSMFSHLGTQQEQNFGMGKLCIIFT